MGIGQDPNETDEVIAEALAPEQYEQARELHQKMGMDYQLPNLESPLLLVKKAVRNSAGDLLGFCILRLTAECMLLVDPDLRPDSKMEVMTALSPSVIGEAYAQGLDDVMATIPEDVEQKFAKRLAELGWAKDRNGWALWSRPTEAM